MGAMLGITTESASKMTAEFRRNGLLKLLEDHRAWIDAIELKSNSINSASPSSVKNSIVMEIGNM
jgi:hypothetical protein